MTTSGGSGNLKLEFEHWPVVWLWPIALVLMQLTLVAIGDFSLTVAVIACHLLQLHLVMLYWLNRPPNWQVMTALVILAYGLISGLFARDPVEFGRSFAHVANLVLMALVCLNRLGEGRGIPGRRPCAARWLRGRRWSSAPGRDPAICYATSRPAAPYLVAGRHVVGLSAELPDRALHLRRRPGAPRRPDDRLRDRGRPLPAGCPAARAAAPQDGLAAAAHSAALSRAAGARKAASSALSRRFASLRWRSLT